MNLKKIHKKKKLFKEDLTWQGGWKQLKTSKSDKECLINYHVRYTVKEMLNGNNLA